MKALTEKQRQWLWFTSLWCAGLIAFFLLAYLARWLISIT
jgi:hypothetical protein